MSNQVSYDLFGQEFRDNAYQIFAALREQAPVAYQAGLDGKTMTWFVSSFAHIDTILRDDNRFVRDPLLALTDEEMARLPPQPPIFAFMNEHMLNKDGSDHRRLRGLVSKAFTPRMVEQLRDRIQAVADTLIDNLEARGEMDVINDYAFPLAFTVFAELLGIAVTDREKFQVWTDALMAPPMRAEAMGQFAELMQQFVAFLHDIFVLRRQEPQDDLITALVQVEEAGDILSESELFSMVVLLITGGYESTASFIGNAVLALLYHPEQLIQFKAHPENIPLAVEELLRFDAPFERVRPRWATEDVEIGGQCIRRGDMIFLLLGAANHDPARFADPEALDLTRTPNQHLGFGRGVHYCLGAPLARLESEIALTTLFQRLPDLRFSNDFTRPIWRASFVRGLTVLPITWAYSEAQSV